MKMKKRISAGFLSVMLACAMLGGNVLAADTDTILLEPAETYEESVFAETETEITSVVKKPGYVGEVDVIEVPDEDETADTEAPFGTEDAGETVNADDKNAYEGSHTAGVTEKTESGGVAVAAEVADEAAKGTEEAVENKESVDWEAAENVTVHRKNVRRTVIITSDGVDSVISDTCLSGDELEEAGDTISYGESMVLMVGEAIWDTSPADKSYDEYYYQNYGEAALKRKVKVKMKPSGIVSISQKANKDEKYLVEKAKKPGDVQVEWITSWKDGKETKTEITQFTDTVVTCKLNKTKFTINDTSQIIDLYDYMSWVDQQYPNKYYAEWKSSNEKVATVSGGDDNGVVSFLGFGSAKITGIITTDLGGKITMTATFKVVLPKLSKELIVLKPGKSVKISLKNVDPDAQVTWTTSDQYPTTGNGPNAVVQCDVTGINGYYARKSARVGTKRFYFYVATPASGYLNYNVNLGNGQTTTVEAMLDRKSEAEYWLCVDKFREKNGLNVISDISALSSGAETRALEMTQAGTAPQLVYRPDGSWYSTAYSQSLVVGLHSVGNGSGTAAYKAQVKYNGLESDYLNDSNISKMGIRAIKTKQKYKIDGKGYNWFLASAFAY